MKIPSYNNVYGYFLCPYSLENVAKIFVCRLDLSAANIRIKKSQFDGTQEMRVLSEIAEFEIYKSKGENEYFFNGAVAGTAQEVYCYTQEVQMILNQSKYSSRFEIYDEAYNCIEELT